MSKKQQQRAPGAPDASAAGPVAPAGAIPWRWLGLAVLAGGLVGWAMGSGSLLPKRSAAPSPTPAPVVAPKPNVLAAVKPPGLPTGLSPAQSNAIFQMTNVPARISTNLSPGTFASAATPPLITISNPPPAAPAAPLGQALPNGIVLPAVWPPKNEFKPGEPMPVPYLSNPPPVIQLTGRQLFVDDFLIAESTLKRTWHQPVPYSNNPVLKPDRAWEQTGGAMAMPFSDGVWMDPMNWVSPPEFKPADVMDVFRLIAQFQTATNALGTNLLGRFSAAAQAQIKTFTGADMPAIEAMQRLLAEELNRLLTGPSLYDAARFQGVKLSDRSGALLAQNPRDARLARLNRWLLEDAFPRELFRMQPVFTCHYLAGYGRGTALAISTNGLDWEKPNFDVRPGSNLVQTDPRDSATVWFTPEDPDPARRYKLWRSHSEDGRFGLSLHFSPDGIHWSPRALRTGSNGDRSTVFWNPFRQVWVYSLRHGWGEPRARRYWEVKDLLAGPQWREITEPPMWVGSDRLDPLRADLQVTPQLYNLDAVGYESLMVGLFTIWRGDKNIPEGRPKPNSIWLGFSRDGYHWDRPVRQPFIDVSERKGDWNWGNVQSVAGGFAVVGRNLHFYYSGRSGADGKRDAGGAMGLATLRRDGFCSMDAGPAGGVLTTRPVAFSPGSIFVNMQTNAPDGEMRIEILHADGRPITLNNNKTQEQNTPFTKDNASPLVGDQTLMSVMWANNMQDLSVLAGRPVRFRFHLKNASLYSFWISPARFGRSLGPVAAGGPHFTGLTDLVGSPSYRPFPAGPRPHAPPATNAPAAPVPPAPVPVPATPPAGQKK